MSKFTAWICCAVCLLATPALAASKVPVKVVVVTMFESAGEQAGERQLWQERMKLDRVLPLPAAQSDIYANDQGVLCITTGMGVSNAAASVMALGLDPRFDLSHAYWLVAGISGIDPHDGSMGSAVWTRYVVDGGLAHELDAREIPADWSTGYVPLGATKPYDRNNRPLNPGQLFRLNEELLQWAFELTKSTVLQDGSEMAKRRAQFDGFSNAQKPPFVLIGSNLSDSTFWHGARMTEFGNAWVRFWTDGLGNFTTKAMEDSGTLQALTNLDVAGKVDFERVMILRTASNYTMQSPDMTAAQSLARERGAALSAYKESIEAAFRVGHPVVQAIVQGWPRYEKNPPTVKQSQIDKGEK